MHILHTNLNFTRFIFKVRTDRNNCYVAFIAANALYSSTNCYANYIKKGKCAQIQNK